MWSFWDVKGRNRTSAPETLPQRLQVQACWGLELASQWGTVLICVSALLHNVYCFPSMRAFPSDGVPQAPPPSPEVCSTFPRAQWVSRHLGGPNEDESALISHLEKARLIYLWWFWANPKCFVAGLKVCGDFLVSIYELETKGERSQPVSYLFLKPIFFK